MAERRMFTQKITESDAFLDMSLTAQALYFHLCMHADDDGFIKNPKRICRMIGGNDDDLNLLLAKRFALSFANGVIVIKHWRMHNLLRRDRYHPSEYIEERAMLHIKDNSAYTLDSDKGKPVLTAKWQPDSNQMTTKWQPDDNQMTTKWQPDDNQMAPEDSIGKDSIGKDSKEVSSLRSDTLSVRQTDYDTVKDMWNELDGLGDIKGIVSISQRGKRKSLVGARLKEYGVDGFREAIEQIKQSDFLQGKHKGKPWAIYFDWFIRPSNFPKVLEGNYANNDRSKMSEHDRIAEAWFNDEDGD